MTDLAPRRDRSMFLRISKPGIQGGPVRRQLAQIEMDAPLYSPPALVGDALYLATANRFYFIAVKH